MDALVIGGSGGIGQAFVEHFLQRQEIDQIHVTYHNQLPDRTDPRVQWHQVDVTREADIEKLCAGIDDIEFCINAVGMLHDDEYGPETSTRQIDADYFFTSMAVNALPILLLAKYMVAHFKHKRPAVFATVLARVGKYAFYHEVELFFRDRYVCVVYQHLHRQATQRAQIKQRALELKQKVVDVTKVFALRYAPYTARAYFILASSQAEQPIKNALHQFRTSRCGLGWDCYVEV